MVRCTESYATSYLSFVMRAAGSCQHYLKISSSGTFGALLLAPRLVVLLLEGRARRGAYWRRKSVQVIQVGPNFCEVGETRCYRIRPLVPHKGLCGVHLLLEVLELDGFFYFAVLFGQFWLGITR